MQFDIPLSVVNNPLTQSVYVRPYLKKKVREDEEDDQGEQDGQGE